MNEAAKNEIRRLADAELEEVKKEFPAFSSCYEAYAAGKAATENAWNEAQALDEHMEGIWTLTKTKQDQDPEVLHAAYTGIYRIAVDLAAAATICAAMARNAILSSEEMLLFENERKEGGEDE